MTQDEIMKLEAGRKLDAMIGENLFGIPHSSWGTPFYSTDIAAAWLVVEKMRADGYEDYHEYGEDKMPWWLFEKDDEHYCAEAETDMLAICRAALLAKMER